MSDTQAGASNLTNTEEKRNLWSIKAHSGARYMTVLRQFHTYLKPRTYLEIGVNEGASLNLATCASIAIDPKFDFKTPLLTNKEICLFYQMTSDDFFRRFDPNEIFGSKIDLAFLDGMHWFEFLLRDFVNVEKHCARNSVVVLHDCIPLDEHAGRRLQEDSSLREFSDHKSHWAGDVWKTVAILKKYRSDLRIVALDAPPTGLVCITNLNPSSNVLSERYFEIVREFSDFSLARHGDEYMKQLNLSGTNMVATSDAMSAQFWL